MQMMTCLALSAWLRRADLGLNAAIGDAVGGALDRWPGHAAPPALAVIACPFDESDPDDDPSGQLSADADRVARWEAPRAYPALYIVPDGPVQVEAEVATRSRDADLVGVSLRYLVRNANRSRQSARDAAYTMEALHRSLKYFLADDETGRTARTGQGKMIFVAEYAAYGPWAETIGAAHAEAVFALRFSVRNRNP